MPDDPSSTIIAVKSDNNAATVNGQKTLSDGLIYDPAFVYVLELCTVLSLKDENSVLESGAQVSEALQSVIRDSANYHPTLVARAVFYLLSLLHASYVRITEPLALLQANQTCRNTHSYESLSYSILSLVSKMGYWIKRRPLFLKGLRLVSKVQAPYAMR